MSTLDSGRASCPIKDVTLSKGINYGIKFEESELVRSKVRSLDFYSSKLDVLPMQLFQKFPRVNSITLRDCDLNVQLDENLFEESTAISSLTLQRNGISEIKEGALQDLLELTFISILDEELNTLPEKIFQYNKKLQTAILVGNGFTHLAPNTFKFNREMTILNLANNKLRNIEGNLLISLRVLIRLNLNNNQLDTLPENLFRSNPGLKEISLNNNKIKKLGSNTFKNLNNLESLSMKSNVCVDRVVSVARINQELKQCYDN